MTTLDEAGDLHVYPVGDLREHVLRRDCWRKPSLERPEPDSDVLVTHNSADGRELVEKHGLN